MSILTILISSIGFSLYVFTFSILWTTSIPLWQRANIVCFLSLYAISMGPSTRNGGYLQPRRLLCGDEELTTVSVRPGVRHTDRIGFVMFERGELVLKFFSPY